MVNSSRFSLALQFMWMSSIWQEIESSPPNYSTSSRRGASLDFRQFFLSRFRITQLLKPHENQRNVTQSRRKQKKNRTMAKVTKSTTFSFIARRYQLPMCTAFLNLNDKWYWVNFYLLWTELCCWNCTVFFTSYNSNFTTRAGFAKKRK